MDNLIHKKEPKAVPLASGPEDIKRRTKNMQHLGSYLLSQLFSDQRFETEIGRHATPLPEGRMSLLIELINNKVKYRCKPNKSKLRITNRDAN